MLGVCGSAFASLLGPMDTRGVVSADVSIRGSERYRHEEQQPITNEDKHFLNGTKSVNHADKSSQQMSMVITAMLQSRQQS